MKRLRADQKNEIQKIYDLFCMGRKRGMVQIYDGNSISKLQIQVATYVFESSVRNCHR
jgi:hypothetical protein